MSDALHAELADEMMVTHTGPPGMDLIYAPLGGSRQEPPYDELDPGIRETVRWLFNNQFDPTDSGDGVSKPTGGNWCNQPHPHVYMTVREPDLLEGEVERLHLLLQQQGVRLFAGPMNPEEAEGLGVKWEAVPEGAVSGCLEGNYAPGGPAIIMLAGVNDVILGRRDGA